MAKKQTETQTQAEPLILSKRRLGLADRAKRAVATSDGAPVFVADLAGVATGHSVVTQPDTGDQYQQLDGVFRARYADGSIEQSKGLAGLAMITTPVYGALEAGAINVTIEARLYAVPNPKFGFEWRVLESPASLPVSVPEFPALPGSGQLAIE